MTATILNQIGNRTEPARIRFDLESPVLDRGTRLRMTINSASLRRILFPSVVIDEVTPFPIYLWDWWTYISFKYQLVCDFKNIGLSKVEQITDKDVRFDVYPQSQAEYVRVAPESLEWEPVYLNKEPDRIAAQELIYTVTKKRWPKICPEIGPQVDFRIIDTGEPRVTADGDLRIIRPLIESVV